MLALVGTPKASTGPNSPTESAPSNFVFTAASTGTNSATLTVGVSVSFIPAFTGTITNCTVNPALPAGLSLNPTTCAITGVPTVAFAQTTFTITASNQYGSTTATISLTGTANPPANLAFPSGTATFTTGVSSSLVPTFTGGITNCTISPALPTGIVLNPSTCAIVGTPTIISAQQNYTITASNQFGNTTANLNFGINTLAPQNMSFSFGATTSVNTNTTVNFIPTVIGGITSCSVNPSLPVGLSLNDTTCAITGTPTVGTSSISYTVTATNQYGSTNAIFSLATPLVAPTAFSFPYAPASTTIYTIGTAVNVSPAITGVVTNCTSSPSLPAGLTLNTTNCSVTGTPTSVSVVTNYTITASNGSGTVNTVIRLQVNNVPPSNLVYPFGSSTILPVGTAQSISPTFTGGVTSCTASPSLPTGLSINATTCAISGTPSAARVATNYTITATNSFGSTNVIVNIAVQLFPPSNISFPFVGGTTSFTTGVAVNITPTISGIVTSCTVSPTLPAGLSLNNTTCRISGTPSGTSPATNYTITATNAAGSTNIVVTIGVNPPAPSNLVYPASGVLSFAISVSKTITPTKTGTVVSCSSNPSLPAGLSLNNTTCAISGIATVEQNAIAYIITASNGGGDTTANITITVAQPPLNLTYPTLSITGYKNNVAMNISPSVTGTGITYSITPTLPTGISLNTATGVISGTYNQNEGSSLAYVITATNSGGSTTLNATLTFFGKPTYQTGQTLCYDVSGNVIPCAGTGQDGEFQAGQPHAVYSGPNQHPTYTNDYTTTDTTTGLVWKTCVEGLSGADCGTGNVDTSGSYSRKCNFLNSENSGQGYAGKSDWRHATPDELDRFANSFLMNHLSVNFPGVQTGQGNYNYVYSSPSLDTGQCYKITLTTDSSAGDSFGGASPCGHQTPGGPERCVSGSSAEKIPKYIETNNNTVIDYSTGIMWQKCAIGVSGSACQTGTPTLMNWTDAINTCKNLNLNGRTWKLPNSNEAMSLYNTVLQLYQSAWADPPTIPFAAFPFDVTAQEGTWTSTSSADKLKSYSRANQASRSPKLKTDTNRVRCISVE